MKMSLLNISKAGKLFIILSLVAMFCGEVSGEEGEKLMWEYKYNENENLLYSFKGKEWKKDYGVFKGFEKDVEGVLAQAVRNRLSEDKVKIITWTKIKEGNDFKDGNQFAEGVTGGLEFSKDGNAEGLSWLDCFHLSLPRFVESGLDLWSKDIELNEAIGQKAGQRIKLTGYYSKLGEEVIDGDKCVIIKTEIGGLEKGTYEEKGTFKRMGAEAKIRIEAKSWFNPARGRVVKMESELKLYENGAGGNRKTVCV